MSRGFTLLELIVTCALIGLFASVTLPRTAGTLDRLRVTQAAEAVAGAVHLGRTAAIARSSYLRVIVDEAGRVCSAGVQASHILLSLSRANGLVDVPPGTQWPAGTPVRVLRWPGS